MKSIILQKLGIAYGEPSIQELQAKEAVMFDRQQLNPLHTVRQSRPYLRPDLMRWEHIECLHRHDSEKRADLWRSAWQGFTKIAEHVAVCAGNKLLCWAEKRKLRYQ